MRTANAGDWWRRVYQKQYPTRLVEVAYANVLGLGSGSVVFRGGITAISGENGAGKSTLLNAIRLGVSDYDSQTAPSPRFADARVTVSFVQEGRQRQIETDFAAKARTADSPAPTLLYLSPSSESQRILALLQQDANFGELLEGYSPRLLTAEELETCAYVIGRQYDKCEVFEIEDYKDWGLVPYFRVTVGNVSYGSEMMGLGELALHLTLWSLQRTPPCSLVLLEEPETHVAPRSQSALLDAIARVSVRQDLWVILSTHSSAILAHVPSSHVRLLYRDGLSAHTLDAPSEVQLKQVLGVPSAIVGVLLVEDKVATMFAHCWLSLAAPEILQHYVLDGSKPAAEIEQAIRSFPHGASAFKVVGLYDGDQRAKSKTLTQPHAFLPGEIAPERLLRDLDDIEAIASELRRTPADLKFVLSQLIGFDHHDWLLELAKRMGFATSDIVRALVAVWLRTPHGSELSNTALAHLRATLAS